MDRRVAQKMFEHPDLTEGERYILKWQYKQLGSFYTSLIECMTHADHQNLGKLALAFPSIVEAFKRYRDADLQNRFDELEEQLIADLEYQQQASEIDEPQGIKLKQFAVLDKKEVDDA